MNKFVPNTGGLINDDRESGVFRVHRSAFVDQEILELEREQIFDRCWLFTGHASEIPNPGNFVSRNVAGRPVIMVRSDDGKIRVLMNTCRHRGNLVCRDHRGNSDVFRCFYHGWIYNNRGELKGIPGEEAYSDAFDREALGLESAPQTHNHRGCIFISFQHDIESFESYMADALPVLDNTLDLGDMEFAEGHLKYAMRANWKLLMENSLDGYHGEATHERFFDKFIPAMGMRGYQPASGGFASSLAIAGAWPGTVPLGNGHVTMGYPSPARGSAGRNAYLEKFAEPAFRKFGETLTERFGPEKARMIGAGSGNYLIFPNLVIVDGWKVFRTFYPVSPDYMEINGWACLPKGEPPELRAARLDWYLGFQGPGGFATPDDVEALEGCQMGFATHKEVEWSDISRDMKGNPGRASELQMRVFWREWHARLTTGKHAATTDD